MSDIVTTVAQAILCARYQRITGRPAPEGAVALAPRAHLEEAKADAMAALTACGYFELKAEVEASREPVHDAGTCRVCRDTEPA